MAVNSFIPTLWSARLLVNLQKAQVFAGLVNRDYEGEIANAGDTVKINGIGAVTVGAYAKNSTSLSWQTLADASQALLIDQSKYFAFKVDDVDKVQTNVNLIDAAMQEAAYALSDNIDQFIAGLHAQVGNLRNGGNDGHARCHKHAPYLEGDEEQQDREKIDQEFHMQGSLEGRSAWRVGVVLVVPQSAAQCFV